MKRLAVLMVLGTLAAAPAAAQQDAANLGAKLLQDPAIKSAVEAIRAAPPYGKGAIPLNHSHGIE